MDINLDNFERLNSDIFDLVIIPTHNDIGGGKIIKEEIDIITWPFTYASRCGWRSDVV